MKFQAWAILQQKRLIIAKPWLTELKQVLKSYIDYVVDELHEKTKIPCHETPNFL